MMIMQPTEAVFVSLLLRTFDLVGTFVFAISGAVAGAKHRLDLFGIVVLAFVAGTFGGITRDVMIGAIPPAAILDWKYVAVSILAGITTFFWSEKIGRLRNAVLIFDAGGLALFAVSGAGKALAYHVGPIPAALLGMVTGIGGGVVRDVLVSEVPAVFRTDIYALAALAASSIFVVGEYVHLSSPLVAIVSALLCFVIRMIAIHRKWQIPVAKSLDPPHA